MRESQDWPAAAWRRALRLGSRIGLLLLIAAAQAACSGSPQSVSSGVFRAGWRPVATGEAAGAVQTDDPRLRRFDPARLQQFPVDADGVWILLWPSSGRWPAAPWVLTVQSAGLQTVTAYPPGAPPQRQSSLERDAAAWPGHGRLAFAFATAPPPGQPLRLRLQAREVIASPVSFALQPVPEFLRADAHWLALASACLAIMMAMAVMALVFAQRLRDPTFVYYAVFVSAYALILATQSGYIADPLGWQALAASVGIWGRLATAVAVIFAVLFLDRFADLRRWAPRARSWLFAYVVVLALLALSGWLPIAAASRFARLLINPLLVLGGPLLFGLGALAAWRGSRYARFFLLGWTPLLVVTVLGSLQLYGVLPQWRWSDLAALAAGAFEALVLSLGLAERSLALRRDRDSARRLADTDALTGLLNRRAWSEQAQVLVEVMHRRRLPLSLLFLDLDRFKLLNDGHGHAAGDGALRLLAEILRVELREQDCCSRYGGEEFVAVLPAAHGARALEVAERIRLRFQQQAGLALAPATPTVSIGVAELQADEALAGLIARADAALYAAKADGRNRVQLCRESERRTEEVTSNDR